MKIDVKKFNDALEEIIREKSTTREVIVEALKDSMAKAYRKHLEDSMKVRFEPALEKSFHIAAQNAYKNRRALQEEQNKKSLSEGNNSNVLDTKNKKENKATNNEQPAPAKVRVDLDLDKGNLNMYYIRDVVEEVNDDFLEIELDDARKVNPKYQIGDEFLEEANLDVMEKFLVMSIKSLFKQKSIEVERNVLNEQFKNRVDSLISGKVETVLNDASAKDPGLIVRIGPATFFVSNRDLAGNERYRVGDSIRLFVKDTNKETSKKNEKIKKLNEMKEKLLEERNKPQENDSVKLEDKKKEDNTNQNTGKGSDSSNSDNSQNKNHIKITRADAGFVECLMKEDIREIANNNIKIVDIVREPGRRTKVAVSSNDPKIEEPASVCIGKNGITINQIIEKLSNNPSSYGQERIEVFPYSDYLEKYVLDAMRPAKIAGVKIEVIKNETKPNKNDNKFNKKGNKSNQNEEKSNDITLKAYVVLEDDLDDKNKKNNNKSMAIGVKGSNVRLASQITGAEVSVMTLDEAKENGIKFIPTEEINRIEEERKKKIIEENYTNSLKEREMSKDKLPGEISKPSSTTPKNYVSPFNRHFDDDVNIEYEQTLQDEADKEAYENYQYSKLDEEKKDNIREKVSLSNTKIKEETLANKIEEKVEVKTEIKLPELEKQLAEQKAKEKKIITKHSKKEEKVEEETTNIIVHDTKIKGEVYSEEEKARLAQQKAQEEEEAKNNEDSAEKYDEYDDDNLYD